MEIKRNIYFKIIRKGLIVEKFFTEAKKGGQFTNSQGQVIKYEDKPEKYYLNIITGENLTNKNGFEGAILMPFEVDKDTYDISQTMEQVDAVFKMKSGDGELIPEEIISSATGLVSKVAPPSDKDAPPTKTK
ncbi:MAG: hypothetical protein IJW82_07055 [Clostridia bacterium]|nr:hypothetical protein [Clostridia bacterium]